MGAMSSPNPQIEIGFNGIMLSGHLGGIGNYTYHLLRALRQVRPHWRLTLHVDATVAEAFRGIEGLVVKCPPFQSRFARLLYFHLLFRFFCQKYRLLHSVGNIGMVKAPIPQVITLHDCYENVSPERFHPFKRGLMQWLIRRSGRDAAAIMTDSENSRRDIIRFYPELGAKTQVVLLGNKYPVVEHPFTGKCEYFLFVGTLEPGKNLPLLLKALAKMPKPWVWRLKVIGGQGWRQSHLPALLRDLELEAYVDFLGYVGEAELVQWYARAIALILPSQYEGFGLPAIEAMACGCPAILADNSSLPEAGGDAAVYFKSGDANNLQAAMEKMMTDSDMRQACIAKGLRHAATFDWLKTATETAQVIESVLHKRGSA